MLRLSLFVLLVALIQESFPFVEKMENVCHSDLDCGRARVTCDAGQRAAVLGVKRSYHVDFNASLAELCPPRVDNCSAVPDMCCRPWSSFDCAEDYSDDILVESYVNCSAHVSKSGRQNETCYIDLPSDSQPPAGRCSRAAVVPGFQNLSSFSSVKYACVDESNILPVCGASQIKGNLLYTLWTPKESAVNLNNISQTSCRCSVESSSPIKIFIRVLDIRIPHNNVSGGCSYVTVVDSVKTVLNTSCTNDTILLNTASQKNGLTEAFSPLDVSLFLQANNVPDIVWVGFAGLESEELILTCYSAGENLTRLEQPSRRVQNETGSLVSVPAIIGGSVAAMVFIIIFGLAIFNSIKRKRSFNSKRMETRTWWERTKQEDRIAELSQLGTASKVIIDSGRNMNYGKHPPTNRSFPTSDSNPPIYFVPGSAFPHADPNQPDLNCQTANDQNEQSEGNAAESDTSNCPWSSATVHYIASHDSKSAVAVSNGNTVKIYDIPPLTIKELDND